MVNFFPVFYKKMIINKYLNKDCTVNELLKRYDEMCDL